VCYVPGYINQIEMEQFLKEIRFLTQSLMIKLKKTNFISDSCTQGFNCKGFPKKNKRHLERV
jgi:hypothetical protein